MKMLLEINESRHHNSIYKIYIEAMMKPLLLAFRSQSSALGVTRETLKEMASTLGVSETQAVHVALVRMKDWLESLDADNDPGGTVTPNVPDETKAAIRKSLLNLINPKGDENVSELHPPGGGSVVVPVSRD